MTTLWQVEQAESIALTMRAIRDDVAEETKPAWRRACQEIDALVKSLKVTAFEEFRHNQQEKAK